MSQPRRLEQLSVLPHVVKWTALASVVGALAGTASAIFLASLDWVTAWREAHPWIIVFLPVGGFVIGWIYHRMGKSVEAGNNLLLEEIHDPKNSIPRRMAPMILLTTLATHLFGGSAGREGTAVQMGGSLADRLTRPLRLGSADRRILLMAGVSAGFGSVFGTPLAGAVFGLEVLAIGRVHYDALYPCLVASIVGDAVTAAWGIHHTVYPVAFVPAPSLAGLARAGLAGVTFGVVGMLFAGATRSLARIFERRVAYGPLRTAIGGGAVALGVYLMGSTRYVGLGIPTIVVSFTGRVRPWDFAGKFLFTVVTLGSGFKGGEVTPLFFIGATLGNALAGALALPAPVLAGLGFAAAFAGAANTPVASTLLAIELFGGPMGPYAACACVVSYLFSGHAGIYRSQRVGLFKHSAAEQIEPR